MKCLECHDALQCRLDGDTTALTPDVIEHLGRCASCRREYAAAEAFLRGVAAIGRPDCPPDFAQRMAGLVMRDLASAHEDIAEEAARTASAAQDLALQSLVEEEQAVPLPSQPRRRSRRYVRPAIGFAMAAAMLLAAGYIFLRAPATPTIADAPKDPEPVAQQKPLPQKQIIDIDHNPVPENVAKMDPVELEAVAASLRQTGAGMAEGLQPMTKTARRALNFFFRELPVINNGK